MGCIKLKRILYKKSHHQRGHGRQRGKTTSARCTSDSMLVSSAGKGPVSPVPLLDRIAFIFNISF